jgi:hypothetical protein
MKFNIIVIDNFYENPYTVREYALNQDYIIPEYQPRRTDFITDINSTIFDKILSPYIKKIIYIDSCFHYRISSEKKFIHFDAYDIAGIIYLTPDADVNSGTSFYTKTTNNNDKYKLISTIGNIFNRLILFDSKQYHVQTNEFGNNIYNSRLTQTFAINVEK